MTYRDAPAPIVEAAFGIAPNVRPAPGDWVRLDTTNKPRSAKTKLGRQQRLAAVDPGELVLVLADTDAHLDPTNTASTVYGQWDIGTRIRIRLDFGGGDIRPLFEGNIEDLLPGWQYADADITVTVVDRLVALAQVTLPRSVYVVEQTTDTAAHSWPLGEAGLIAEDTVADKDGSYFVNSTTTDPLTLLDQRPASVFNGVDQYVSIPTYNGLGSDGSNAFTFECWLQTAKDFNPGNAERRIWEQSTGSFGIRIGVNTSDVGGNAGLIAATVETTAGLNATSYSTVRVDDGKSHHLAVTWSAAGLRVYVDGTDVTNVILTTPFAAPTLGPAVIGRQLTSTLRYWKGQLGLAAAYPSALSAARVLAHFQAGFTGWDNDLPGTRIGRILDLAAVAVADRDLAAGIEQLGPAHLDSVTALAYCNQVALTDQGILFASPDGKITYRGRPGSGAASRIYDTQRGMNTPVMTLAYRYSVDRIVNRAIVQRRDGLEQIVDDAISRASPVGPRDQTYATLHRSPAAARQMAADVVVAYGVPILLLEQLTVNGRDGDATLNAVMPSLQEIVNAAAHPPGRAAISQDSTIERIEHDINWQQWKWDVTLGFAARSVNRYFTWDDGTGTVGTAWGDANHRWTP